MANRGEHSPGGGQPEETCGRSGACREHASEELTSASHADLAEYRHEMLLNGVAGDAQAVAELAGVEPVSQERDQLVVRDTFGLQNMVGDRGMITSARTPAGGSPRCAPPPSAS